MALYDKVRELPVELEAFRTERLQLDVSSDFTRVTTVVVLEGGGETGRGEDVTYQADAHDGFPELRERGSMTFDELSRRLELYGFDDYRRWAFESAALDLALRQNGLSLGRALGREYRPVRFVVSTRGDAFAWLQQDPSLELKLDPAEDWDREFMERLAGTGRVRVLDLKAYYRGTVVDLAPEPNLYRAIVEIFADVVIEDAWLEGECRTALEGAEERLSFDAPVHSLADLRALPLEPHWLNVKPSRFGTVERLLECLEYCEDGGIAMYGGGQFELGVGRAQIQALASLFYPDGPNDVAPAVYNEGGPRPGLPQSPLPAPDGPGL
jgi:L-alanine-DL-glutamate epimerase-like enolase superfamily enzyme